MSLTTSLGTLNVPVNLCIYSLVRNAFKTSWRLQNNHEGDYYWCILCHRIIYENIDLSQTSGIQPKNWMEPEVIQC